MKKNGDDGFFVKLSSVIVDKKNIILLLYTAGIVFSLISQNWVSVCNDITQYLPNNTETRRGLGIMDSEFTTYATSKAMLVNITYPEAEKAADRVRALSGVSTVDFDDTEKHYKDGCALLDITLDTTGDDAETALTYNSVRTDLSDCDVYFSESDSDDSKALDGEMNTVLIVAAVIIVSVLLFTSNTFMEVPVLIATFIGAALLNKGTNYLLGEISFISNSVTLILQLALSIDYAIIMIHHYSEERRTRDLRGAVIYALSKAIPEISSSCLTTVSGLLAMMFMQFKIGFDLGLCLIKSIAFSLLAVFTLMPCLLMLFGKYIDKTPHKSLVPDISGLGNIVYKLRAVVPPIFICVIIAGYFVSSGCPYVYDVNSSGTDRKSETQLSKEMIDSVFGTDNLVAVIVPTGEYDKEKKLISELEKYPEVSSVTSLSNIEVDDGYVLTDSLTPRRFSELTGIDVDIIRGLYGIYAAENKEYATLVGNIDSAGVPLIDMLMYLFDKKDEGYVNLDNDTARELNDLQVTLNSAKDQLMGENYTRILVHLNLPTEGDETFDFLDKMNAVCADFYEDFCIVGDSTASRDLASSFATDNIIVSVLSVLFVILVLFFTFKSAGLPLLQIAVIQGSVWINFSLATIFNTPIYFLSYLIVSSIQMGANIDYAIVISSRYMELKKEMTVKDAMRKALKFAFPTVLTSGSILASAGFLIGKLSTNPAIVSIGKTLSTGTLTSMFLVMCVLPEILLLGDTIIEKTKFTVKTPDLVHKDTGSFVLNGRVRGYINGYVDADMHGILHGDMAANVNMSNILKEGANDEVSENN